MLQTRTCEQPSIHDDAGHAHLNKHIFPQNQTYRSDYSGRHWPTKVGEKYLRFDVRQCSPAKNISVGLQCPSLIPELFGKFLAHLKILGGIFEENAFCPFTEIGYGFVRQGLLTRETYKRVSS